MRANRRTSFDEFYSELENEAQAEGPRAVADLRAKEVRYALINALITSRHALNLSQEGLAVESGVAQTEISKIERGRKSPTLETFSRLVSALKIEVLPVPTNLPATGMVAFATGAPAPSVDLASASRSRTRAPISLKGATLTAKSGRSGQATTAQRKPARKRGGNRRVV